MLHHFLRRHCQKVTQDGRPHTKTKMLHHLHFVIVLLCRYHSSNIPQGAVVDQKLFALEHKIAAKLFLRHADIDQKFATAVKWSVSRSIHWKNPDLCWSIHVIIVKEQEPGIGIQMRRTVL